MPNVLDFNRQHMLPVKCFFYYGFIEIQVVGTLGRTLEVLFIFHKITVLLYVIYFNIVNY
jgi:hypothetical protein